MYLKKLEMQGFKSFADKTVLEFLPGITTVIGPNGSGKSNISDAIRWVLGEQSMKSLRGSKSEDVIFAGTQNRKSLGFAEVSLVFDNMDNKLPVEYTEVTVTRKLYRSGESQYFINKAPCRLKDIIELFMDTGIGKDGYSIIGQGRIDEILSNKSEDRRNIFEEAAGIVKYKTRKIEAEKKLERTKLNLLRINDILSEIEQNITPLKAQAEKAKEFLKLREELKSIEVGLYIYNISTYKEKLEKIIEDENILNNQNQDENTNLEKLNELKQNLKIEIDNITKEIEEIQNLGSQKIQEKEKLNSEIKVCNERIANNKENFSRYEKEIEELKNRNKELEEEKTQKTEKQEKLSANKEKFEKELKEKEEELKKATAKLSEKEIEIEEKKIKVEGYTDEKYEKQNEINVLEVTNENIEKRIKALKYDIQVAISELDSTNLSSQDISKAFYESEAKKDKITARIEEITRKKDEEQAKLKDYEKDINNMQSEYRLKESRLKFLIETEKEKEGYSKAIKSLLVACDKDGNLAKCSEGVLSNLISVENKYQVAIEIALGGSLQNIVTKTEEDAKTLVEYLRKNNLGRASFLPMTSVKGKRLDKINSKGVKGEVIVASDIVKYDKKYEQIILNLLGRTVIVENMDDAIYLARQNGHSFKIVTLKGDVINSSGSITGGSYTQKTVNILGRKEKIKELETELKEIDSKIKSKVEEKDKQEKESEKYEEEIESLSQNLQDIQITYATDKQKLVSVQENIAKLRERIDKSKAENEQIEKQKQENIVKINEINEVIAKSSEDMEILKTEIAEFAKINSENQRYIDNLNFDVTNLKISVSSFNESEVSINEMVERINQDISNNNTSIQNKKDNMESITNENDKLINKINEFEEEIKKLDETMVSSDDSINKLKDEREEKNRKLNNAEKEINQKMEVLDGLKEEIIKLGVRKDKVKEDIDNFTNKLWDEYEITPNNAEEFKKPDNIAQTNKRVNELRNKIRNLGSVNVDSIHEYKELSNRYDFMCEQRLDIENTMSKLKSVIQEMTNIMKEQFVKQFKTINQNFGEVFKELFGGGRASLILEDENNVLECGIEIIVQPPGKKLQNMTLLSGGERAFTAIALLFAMLKINPSPFCVLDEIEAALDDVNVYRFADYLKKFTKETQFLVITHRKGTMEAGNSVYGITMEENGISKLLSMKL